MATFQSIILIVIVLFGTSSIKAQTICREGFCRYKDPTTQKFGFSDTKGKVVVAARYDEIIDDFYFGRAIVRFQNKVGCIDAKGNVFLPFEFKQILREQFELIPVQALDGRWGFYSMTGNASIPCAYDNFKILQRGKQIAVQSNGKWGLISAQHDVLIPCNYKRIEPISAKQFEVHPIGSWSIIPASGKQIEKIGVDSLLLLQQDTARINLNGWQFLTNFKGQLLSPSPYQGIQDLHKSFLVTLKGNYWGVQKLPQGTIVIPHLYNAIRLDSTVVHAGMNLHGKWQWDILNYTGTKINTVPYQSITTFAEGRMRIQSLSGKWGFITTQGQEIIAARFDTVSLFSNGKAYVRSGSQEMIIDSKGVLLIDPNEYYWYKCGLLTLDVQQNKVWKRPLETIQYMEHLSHQVKVKVGQKTGVLHTNGDWILKALYDDVSIGKDVGYYGVKKSGIWKVAHSNGKEYTVDKRIVWIGGYCEGFAPMQFQVGLYGYIDPYGKIFIAPQYRSSLAFESGCVKVLLNTKWGVLNKREEWLIQPLYSEFSPFVSGIAIVKEGSLYYLINSDGKIISSGYDTILRISGGYYKVGRQQRWGIHKPDGSELIPARYEEIIPLPNDHFKVRQYELWGVVSSEKGLIINFSFDALYYYENLQLFVGHNKPTAPTVLTVQSSHRP